jgi:hypothetical protein
MRGLAYSALIFYNDPMKTLFAYGTLVIEEIMRQENEFTFNA